MWSFHLQSRREQSSYGGGQTFYLNQRWFEEGKIDDTDQFPWLRHVQEHALDLVLIGATLDAVQTAIEAWNAGFKVILVIIEDRLKDQEEQVRDRVYRISKSCGQTGVFSYGPKIMFSDSTKCMVQVDKDGHVFDTCILTSNGGFHMTAEIWQIIRGPAIVVDPMSVDTEVMEEATQENTGLQESVRGSIMPAGRATRGKFTRPSDVALENEKPTERATVNDVDVKFQVRPKSTMVGEKRKSFEDRASRERAMIVDPEFWEARTDPQAMSMMVVNYSTLCLSPVLGTFQTFCLIAVQREAYTKASTGLIFHQEVWWWRVLADLTVETFAGGCLAVIFTSALGLSINSYWPGKFFISTAIGYWLLGALPMAIPMGPFYASDFLASNVSLFLCIGFSVFYCKVIKKIKISKASFIWWCLFVNGTFGAWVLGIAIQLCYLALLSTGYEALASIMLTFFFTASELLLVKSIAWGYERFNFQVSKKDLGGLCADWKLGISICLSSIHQFIETGRLVCMVCGSVHDPNAMFLANVAVSVVTGYVLNACGRTGWTLCWLGRLLGPKARAFLCPTAFTGLHTEMKYAMGWPRFFNMIGVFIGRGVVSMNWSTPFSSHDPSVWCWSGVTLLTVILVLLGEVLEDWTVYYVLANWPAPKWFVFGDAMMQRYCSPGKEDTLNPCHYMLPRCAFSPPAMDGGGREEEATERRDRMTTMSKTQSDLSTKKLKSLRSTGIPGGTWQNPDLAPPISASSNFKQARILPPLVNLASLAGNAVLVTTCLSMGLGNMNVFTYCKPLEVQENFGRLVRNAFLWDHTC